MNRFREILVQEWAVNVLFLCTGNSARSIMAEAILNEIGRSRFHGFSAGSHPKRVVHPGAISLLKRKGYNVESLRSKSWNEFSMPGGPSFEYVITVYKKMPNELYPTFRGPALKMHWDISDPPEAMDVPAAFEKAYAKLLANVGTLVFGSRSQL